MFSGVDDRLGTIDLLEIVVGMARAKAAGQAHAQKFSPPIEVRRSQHPLEKTWRSAVNTSEESVISH
jgi:hypothetical protein